MGKDAVFGDPRSRGGLITYTAKNAVFNRRDVINNADLLGPLIQELGSLASNL